MISCVMSVTLYTIEGEADRYKVTTVGENGELVEITDQYELVACAAEDGRTGFAVFRRLAPVERHEGPVQKDEDPADVVHAEDTP